MQFLSDRGVFDKGLRFRSMILPDIFIDQDTPEKMYEMAGLDSKSIASKVEETLNSNFPYYLLAIFVLCILIKSVTETSIVFINGSG